MEKESYDGFKLLLENGLEFVHESDRAAAVLAAAYLDHLLGELIAVRMDADPKEVRSLLLKGPLRSFSARINAAYCIGAVSGDTRRHLHRIREIRNRFAHGLGRMTFQEEAVANKCKELKCKYAPDEKMDHRERFDRVCLGLMTELLFRATDEREGERTSDAG